LHVELKPVPSSCRQRGQGGPFPGVVSPQRLANQDEAQELLTVIAAETADEKRGECLVPPVFGPRNPGSTRLPFSQLIPYHLKVPSGIVATEEPGGGTLKKAVPPSPSV